jgi:hypothetical protein
MSVIGRLDGQVDEVLISPLGRKNRQEAIEQDEQAAPVCGAVQTESDATAKKSAEKRDALPVWLL